MLVLYHFGASVFSRRTRLALAHKALDVELRDGRVDARNLEEARRLFPLGTMPVLVDGDRVVGDSTAIAQYLDLVYPERPMLWPRGASAVHDAITIVTAVDLAMTTLVDLGTRYFPLHGDAGWAGVVREKMTRAQAAIDLVGAKATRPFLAGDAWSVADVWAVSAALWVQAIPARAATSPNIAQILTLGFRVPGSLAAWANRHRSRPDVAAVFD